ncbi:MAG: spore photoproduct lyase family protein [Candidatus Methanoperedens sp.]
MEQEMQIKKQVYQMLDGSRKGLVQRVGDGSIICRFEKTPLPEKKTDVICPHFLELKWANGCAYDCAWCFLQGTFRFTGKQPRQKDRFKVKEHVNTFLNNGSLPEVLNTGELSDSLLSEHSNDPFSKFIIPLFEAQKKHKVLFLTKSTDVENLLNIDEHRNVIVSFSMNASAVSKKWEKAPEVEGRIEAARKVSDAGYETRIRIDPMVPVFEWDTHYTELVDMIFEQFTPERITLGSLRGLQSTINNSKDKTWVKFLSEKSNWGKKIDYEKRYEMYSILIDYLKNKYSYTKVALCKESVEMWEKIGLDYKKIRCNCIF